jgi:hypothetical protein
VAAAWWLLGLPVREQGGEGEEEEEQRERERHGGRALSPHPGGRRRRGSQRRIDGVGCARQQLVTVRKMTPWELGWAVPKEEGREEELGCWPNLV